MRKKKYAHITHKSLTITNVEGNGVGGRSMLRRQSGSTLVTSFCYCFQCGSRASLHGCVCVCELDVWSCARLGSCQKSTQTSTLRSDKNTHTLIKSAFGHMLKMSKSRQHVVCKACCHTPYLHNLPPTSPPMPLLVFRYFFISSQRTHPQLRVFPQKGPRRSQNL